MMRDEGGGIMNTCLIVLTSLGIWYTSLSLEYFLRSDDYSEFWQIPMAGAALCFVKIIWFHSQSRDSGSSEFKRSYYFFWFERNYNINNFFDVSPVWCCASYFLTVALNVLLLYKAKTWPLRISVSVWCICSFIYFCLYMCANVQVHTHF